MGLAKVGANHAAGPDRQLLSRLAQSLKNNCRCLGREPQLIKNALHDRANGFVRADFAKRKRTRASPVTQRYRHDPNVCKTFVVS
jgi:hypothetical protein